MVGLLSSTVILTMPKEKPAIQTFAPKFQLTLNRAAQSSVLSGQMVALGLSKDGYSVLKYDHEDWVPIASEEWPHGVLVSFDKEKTPIKLSEDIQPIAVFEPTGLATIFSLKLADIDHSYIFESAGDGRVTIQALK